MWLVVALVIALALGAFLPNIGRAVFSLRYEVPVVLIGIGLGAYGLARAYEGERRAADLSLFFVPVTLAGLAGLFFGWEPVCYTIEDYNYATERRADVLNIWNQCVFQEDEDACQSRLDQEPLHEIDARVQGIWRNLC